MKLISIMLMIFLNVSCMSKKENHMNTQISNEGFKEFYDLFSNSDSFRFARTKLPFPYITIERDDDSEKNVQSSKMINTFPIELDRKKWKEKVIFANKIISIDSIKTIVNIEDTGYHVEILFVRDSKSRKWYAIQVENSSI
jgi:hypothetical protein